MNVTKKALAELQIAMRLDDFRYELDPNKYFNTMKSLVLAESQMINVNYYLELLRSPEREKENELRTVLYEMQAHVIQLENKIDKGDRSYETLKLYEYATYLVRQINKYIKQYKAVREE